MQKTIVKLAALLFALTLLLTGCNLIAVDKVQIVADEQAKLAKEMSAVVAEYDGGSITEFDAYYPFTQTYSMYSYQGISPTMEDMAMLQQSTVESLVEEAAVARQFEERGLEFTETEEELRAESDQIYQYYFDSYVGSVEGDSDEEISARTDLMLYGAGISRERLYEMTLAEHREEAVRESVYAEVTVDEDAVRAEYETRLAAAKDTYSEDLGAFGSTANNGGTVYYVPEGYRSVKHILVAPDQELLDAMNNARTALSTAKNQLETFRQELDTLNDDEPEEGVEHRTAEEIQADIDAQETLIPELEQQAADAEQAVLDALKPTLDEIYGKLDAGESFDSVMAEYGTDPGMKEDAKTAETGYYICADSTDMVPEFTNGAMLLENPGDWSSEPVLSSYGAHILYYNADVPSGDVPFEEVSEKLSAELLRTAQSEFYLSEKEAWVEALHPVYHLENWPLN